MTSPARRLTTSPRLNDAGLYRIVSFDYRIPPHYRGDFAVYVNGDWKAIKFTDTDNPLGYIGKVEGVKADGRWHHAEFNLYEMLVRDDPTAASYIARWFVLADWGSALYNFRRRQIWLDNFQVIPVVSGLQPLKIKVSARDTSGIAGVSWLIDQISTAALPNELKAKSAEFDELIGDSPPMQRLKGKIAKIFYGTQTGVAPPTFPVFVNDPDLLNEPYRRYLANALRRRLPFPEVPIKLEFRPRPRKAP